MTLLLDTIVDTLTWHLCRTRWHDMLSRHPSGTQITLTDTSSANTNITAATQITHNDTSSANTNITAAPQIRHTDTSSADTNITAATQITPTDTFSANTNSNWVRLVKDLVLLNSENKTNFLRLRSKRPILNNRVTLGSDGGQSAPESLQTVISLRQLIQALKLLLVGHWVCRLDMEVQQAAAPQCHHCGHQA